MLFYLDLKTKTRLLQFEIESLNETDYCFPGNLITGGKNNNCN